MRINMTLTVFFMLLQKSFQKKFPAKFPEKIPAKFPKSESCNMKKEYKPKIPQNVFAGKKKRY